MNLQSFESGVERQKYLDFVAFTSTFYKDDIHGKVRSEACFAMLDNARNLGIRVVVGDGGSGSEFTERVKQYPNVTLIHSGKQGENSDLTMGGERRYAGKIATQYFPEAQYFLWLEPEKADLMTKASIDAILDPMRNGEADIVVPSRKSKVTLPPQQKSAENRANRRANYTIENKGVFNNNSFRDRYVFRAFPSDKDDPIDLDKIYADNETSDNTDWHDQWEIDATGKMNAPYDLWFGPKAFTRQSMEQDFLSYKGAKWDSIITSVLAGKLRGKNVVDVPVDFSYPPEQSALEQDSLHAEDYAKKRRIQYRYIMKTIRKLVESATE